MALLMMTMKRRKSKSNCLSSYELTIDDEQQIIQGIVIPDKEMYQQIRFVIENNHLEGWQPSKKDVEWLLKNAVNPDPELIKEYKKIFVNEKEK